jgi:glycosyltransferase involved in cell wall biosynthesis
MRVLITNLSLAGRTGTEVYVRDVAMALLERGHTPIVYSPVLGELAHELRQKTIPVVDNLDAISVKPDVIHGHHNNETMTALLRFPGVPAVYFIHDNMSLNDVAPVFPRILRYVAVDDTCRDRLMCEQAIPEERVRVLYSFVDLEKFKPRGPLPSSPRRALVYSHHSEHLKAVREVCAGAGLALDVAGRAGNNIVAAPELLLGKYDIVFAKARCALEALAVGAAVVLCDFVGSGPMVTTAELNELRRYNFGHRLLRRPLDSNLLAQEIARYDPADAAEVSRRIREMAGLDSTVTELINLYREVIDEYSTLDGGDAEAEARAAACFLRRQSLTFNARLEEERARAAMFYEKYNGLALMRFRKRLLRIPVVGRFAGVIDKKLKENRRKDRPTAPVSSS